MASSRLLLLALRATAPTTPSCVGQIQLTGPSVQDGDWAAVLVREGAAEELGVGPSIAFGGEVGVAFDRAE